MMFIFLIPLIVLIFYAFRGYDSPVSMPFNVHRTALDIVRERYARGEIDEAEFQQRRQELLR